MGTTAAVRYEKTVDKYAAIATGRFGHDAGIAVYVISDDVIDSLSEQFELEGREADSERWTPADWRYARETFLYYVEDDTDGLLPLLTARRDTERQLDPKGVRQ